MKIIIITLFPKMLEGFFKESIVKRAIEKELVEIEIVDLRRFAMDKRGSVDDRPYGGGAGMVLRVDILHKALYSVKKDLTAGDAGISHSVRNDRVILTSAKGKSYSQKGAQEYSKLKQLIIIAGHYEGVDERILQYIDEEISLGDFVLTGGEIAAAAIVDSIIRLIPGVLKKEEASQIESFFTVAIKHLIETVGEDKILSQLKKKGVKEVQLLESPHYTRPEEFEGKKVPDILLSGNHAEIELWRLKKAYEETVKKRPDLLQ